MGDSAAVCRRQKKESWIEVLSLGYTLLEIGLRHLLSSNVGKQRRPVPDARIMKCEYLLDLAKLALNEGFLREPLYHRIETFNKTRRKAIHKLATGTLKFSELKLAAKDVTPNFGEIQALWLTFTQGTEVKVD